MTGTVITKRVLITVRTYPVPALSGIEVSCTAGITSEGEWIRLFPIPYRFLSHDQRFTKYQRIDVDVTKATSDTRPESYHVNPDSIRIVDPKPLANWLTKRQYLAPLQAPSMEYLIKARDEHKHPTLGIFKPKEILKLEIQQEKEPDWTATQLAKLRQIPMFGKLPRSELVKIPYRWVYHYICDDLECSTPHKMSCTDWEMGVSYLRWKEKYGGDWESKFRETYETYMKERYDTHFYVGTVHGHPSSWIIVGLFHPPKTLQGELPLEA